jgi:hypothetical protein
MSKLNQILAVEKGIKSKVQSELTEMHHALQKPALLSGISRVYQPRDDEGERLPSESTRVQVKAEELLRQTKSTLTKLMDVTATKDVTNTKALADVVVDGRVLLTQVPATYLLFLEKQLVDIMTFVKKLPTLDPSETWVKDEQLGVFKTTPVMTVRTKKVPKAFVKAPATDKHPAQVDVFNEDIIVGDWSTVKFSGALPTSEVNAMVEKVEKLQQAVKYARETANGVETADYKAGEQVLSYIFG